MIRRRHLPALLASIAGPSLFGLAGAARAQAVPPWPEVLSKARGQTVYWNAWAGDEKTNAFIAWVGEQVSAQHGQVSHGRLLESPPSRSHRRMSDQEGAPSAVRSSDASRRHSVHSTNLFMGVIDRAP